MRGILKGMRKGRRRLLIITLVGVLVFLVIVLPSLALTGALLDAQHVRMSRPQTLPIPNVVGLKVKDAEKRLKDSGLAIRVNAVRSDLDAPVGVVVDQNPLAGERVESGHAISVIVSVDQSDILR